MSARRSHYVSRIEAAQGRRKLNEAVDYLRASVRPDRIAAVVDELVGIADREGDRK